MAKGTEQPVGDEVDIGCIGEVLQLAATAIGDVAARRRLVVGAGDDGDRLAIETDLIADGSAEHEAAIGGNAVAARGKADDRDGAGGYRVHERLVIIAGRCNKPRQLWRASISFFWWRRGFCSPRVGLRYCMSALAWAPAAKFRVMAGVSPCGRRFGLCRRHRLCRRCL